MNKLLTEDYARIYRVAHQNRWAFRDRGKGDIPAQPTYLDAWWYEKLDGMESTIEPRRLQEIRKRMLAIQDGGVQVKGYIIAHETASLLPAPEPKPINWTPYIEGVKKGAEGMAYGLGVVAVGVAAAAGMALVGLLSVLTADPAVIAVLPDNTRVEIYRWVEL